MKKGFTLAEVLITLAIIGVVAALTIPTLLSNNNTEMFRTNLKKQYSILSQAIDSLYLQNGTVDTSSEQNFINDLATQVLSVKKGTWGTLTSLPASFNYKCYKNATGICSNGGSSKILARPGDDGHQALITKDGVVIIAVSTSANCSSSNGGYAKILPSDADTQNNLCVNIRMDLNGDKGPNQLGMDLHCLFLLQKDGYYYIRPFGNNISTACSASFPDSYFESINCSNRLLQDLPMP